MISLVKGCLSLFLIKFQDTTLYIFVKGDLDFLASLDEVFSHSDGIGSNQGLNQIFWIFIFFEFIECYSDDFMVGILFLCEDGRKIIDNTTVIEEILLVFYTGKNTRKCHASQERLQELPLIKHDELCGIHIGCPDIGRYFQFLKGVREIMFEVVLKDFCFEKIFTRDDIEPVCRGSIEIFEGIEKILSIPSRGSICCDNGSNADSVDGIDFVFETSFF